MHVYFSGIGGTGIGPLALIAHQAGFSVSGSDKQSNSYIQYLQSRGIENIVIGQDGSQIALIHEQEPIDWLVYSSAVPKENPNHPELVYAKEHNITATKRDDFINKLLEQTGQKMFAIAGTHGKTTTTAMAVWLFKQLDIPVSYSVGAKLSFGDMGEFDSQATYFVYEADEYDRNFLSFQPDVSIIPGIAYDHPDIYPTIENYNEAFVEFLCQSNQVFAHPTDLERIDYSAEPERPEIQGLLNEITLPGQVNRENAQLVVEALNAVFGTPLTQLVDLVNQFPGVSRRFEKITENIYSDYAHTPEKIQGALQLAHEVAGEKVVVVYEGLHNTRQHFIKEQLKTLFSGVAKLYIVPSYLAREDKSLEMLSPEKLCEIILEPETKMPAKLDDKLKESITKHANNGDLVLCLTAGGGGSLDEWLRAEFK